MTAVRFNEQEMQRKFWGHSHFMRLGKTATEQYLKMISDAPGSLEYNRVNDQFGIVKYWEEEFSKRYANLS